MPSQKPFVCLQTDFGLTFGSVSSMHGVIASIDPDIRVHDVCHNLPLFNPWAASLCLQYVMPVWPEGTVFVSVVDPGVGTERRACAALTGTGQVIITPDNGTLTHPFDAFGIEEVREIDETLNRRPGAEKAHTFHGRDIFAYTAGKLASGVIAFSGIGPRYDPAEIVRFPIPAPEIGGGSISAHVTASDPGHFGSVSTDVPVDAFESAGFAFGDVVSVVITCKGETLFEGDVLYHRSFGFVKVGEPIVYNGSTGFMMLSLNQANFAARFGIGSGPGWTISFSGPLKEHTKEG